MKNILIYSSEYDPHVDIVLDRMSEVGIDAIRLNTQSIPELAKINLDIEHMGMNSITLIDSNKSFSLDTIKSVWWRRPTNFSIDHQLSVTEKAFSEIELNAVMKSIFNSLDCYWISHPDNLRMANNKYEQLIRAKSIGFRIPGTIISNIKSNLVKFYEKHNKSVIFKVLSDPSLGSTYFVNEYIKNPSFQMPETVSVARTTLLDDEILSRYTDTQVLPVLFQEYVHKKYEIRATVIGDKIFSAKIDSQKHEEAAAHVDWRFYDVEMEPIEMPERINEMCIKLVKSYGLNYGALDLIYSETDEYVFLENNPNGQFIFIEQQVPELKMIDQLIKCLNSGKST